MFTNDINLKENGNGGEISILSNDLLLGNALYTQVYLALFGGNIEANTTDNYVTNEDRFDYWGNELFFKDKPEFQFNSNTERVLKSVALNTAGRYEIMEAVKLDLDYLRKVVNLKIEVLLPSVNNVVIKVVFLSKEANENKVLQLVYDQAKDEIIINEII